MKIPTARRIKKSESERVVISQGVKLKKLKTQRMLTHVPTELDPSFVFSELRSKLMNKVDIGSKYQDIKQMPSWLLDNPDYREIANEHSKKRSVYSICTKPAARRLTPEKR